MVSTMRTITDGTNDRAEIPLTLGSMTTVPSRLVPIGSWCRTAFQCRQHAEGLGLEAVQSGPFDWTVTPYRALSRIFQNDFRQELLLNPFDSYVNRVGSISCGYSGIAFHHDLNPSVVGLHGGKQPHSAIPQALMTLPEWKSARDRFLHTLDNMCKLYCKPGNIFVRWLYYGQASAEGTFPGVFDGETAENLFSLIRMALGHDEFFLICVESQSVGGIACPFDNPVAPIDLGNSRIFNCLLRERLGWNGDQGNDFRGDDSSWLKMFQCALIKFGSYPSG